MRQWANFQRKLEINFKCYKVERLKCVSIRLLYSLVLTGKSLSRIKFFKSISININSIVNWKNLFYQLNWKI